MAITVIQKARRKKITLISGITVVIIALASIFYFAILKKPVAPVSKEPKATTVLTEKLKKLEIKWEILEDKRFQALESFPEISSLTIEESGRENPFAPY